MKLSDEVIGEIAKQLQVAILTGTDVVDNLRLIELETREDDNLYLTEAYSDISEKNIKKLQEFIEKVENEKNVEG